MNGPIVTDIELVYVYVTDLERSLVFYRDVLGIPLERDAHGGDWVEARFPSGVRFALNGAHEGAQPQAPGSVVVDLRTTDLEAALERLKAAGVPVLRLMRESWGSVAHVADPDGHRIDLYERPRPR